MSVIFIWNFFLYKFPGSQEIGNLDLSLRFRGSRESDLSLTHIYRTVFNFECHNHLESRRQERERKRLHFALGLHFKKASLKHETFRPVLPSAVFSGTPHRRDPKLTSNSEAVFPSPGEDRVEPRKPRPISRTLQRCRIAGIWKKNT